MHHPFLGTLRRGLAVAGPLVVVATVAITAATWRGAPRDMALGAVDADRVLGPETDPGDVQLHSGSSPFFTTTGALTTVDTSAARGEAAAMPEGLFAGGSAAVADGHRTWTGFTGGGAAFHAAGSVPRNSAGGSRSSFGAAISGMAMSGGWGGVSGSAASGAEASPASSITRRTTGSGQGAKPAAQQAAASAGSGDHAAAPAAAHEIGTGSIGGAAAAEVAGAPPSAAQAVTSQDVAHEGVAAAAAPSAAAAGASGAAPGASGAVHTQAAAPHPSPASTPEPVTMVLVGIGAVALYRLRRHLV